MLRTAFIGAGRRSQNAHYPNVNRLPDVEMVAPANWTRSC